MHLGFSKQSDKVEFGGPAAKFHFICFCVKPICILFFPVYHILTEKESPEHRTW